MTTISFTDEQLQLLDSAIAASRAHWCDKAVNALIEHKEDEPTFSRIYSRIVELDEYIQGVKNDTKLAA